MATIRKRNGTYQIRVSEGYDINGNQIIKSMTWKPDKGLTPKQTEKELAKQAALFEEKIKLGLAGDGRSQFAEYCRYVLELKERTGTKQSTVERYRMFLPLTDIAIGHLKLADIKPKHLNEFYKQLEQDGANRRTGGKLSNKTILEYHRFISSVLSQAEKEMLIPFNPARKATPPKVAKPPVNYFQVEDMKNIIDALENEPLKYKLLTMLLIATGCRRGEIMGLKWSRIDKDTNTITIDNNLLYSPDLGIYHTTPKNGKARKVKITNEIVSLIDEYKRSFIELKLNNGDQWKGANPNHARRNTDKWIADDYIFVQDNGAPMHPDTITDWLDKFSKRHGLPHINPHAFRHTAASILISEGVDIVTVSHQLGHDKVSTTTDIYSHLIDKASEKAADTLANALFRKQA